jgi:DNA-binding response OmpR family regulator
VADEPTVVPIVLAVFPAEEDRVTLNKIFAGSGWRLLATATLAEALPLLNTPCIGAVISECSFPDGHGWKDLLGVIQVMINPPPLIVADRLADVRLWAEVLNLGAQDLLAKPFNTKEVTCAVSVACGWHNERVIAARKLLKPVERSVAPPADTRAACGGYR